MKSLNNQTTSILGSNRESRQQAAPAAHLARTLATCLLLATTLCSTSPLHAQSAAPTYQPAEWARITAAAKKEGKVVYYIAQPIQVRLAAAFRKAQPDIALEYLRGPSGELLSKVEQERAAGLDGADVWSGTEVAWGTDRAREGNLLRPAGPALAGWPAQHILEGALVLAAREPSIIIYNKTQVKNPPTGYADLLKPEYQGRIGTSELAATLLIAWYDWLEKTQGPDYLPRMRALNPKLYNGSVPLAQAVASGELAVGAFGIPTATMGLIEKGAPIGVIIPSPAFGSNHYAAAFRWSKRPNAALVLLDFLMSAEGQAAWVGDSETGSPRPGVPRSLDFASIKPWDIKDFPPDVVKAYRDKWTRMFK